MLETQVPKWWIYQGNGQPHHNMSHLPAPPPWRLETSEQRGTQFYLDPNEAEERQVIELVNAALYLRRPLLITGKPGVGKTSLAYAVAHELQLGNVLRWSITTYSKLQEGLYHYDAMARLQDTALKTQTHQNQQTAVAPDISQYLRLGPVGTAFAAQDQPRVLLIDEIDKSDIDLPGDLLHLFEEGAFEIPELKRLRKEQARYQIAPWDAGAPIEINSGQVRVARQAFPLVMMTSNEEREFPPAFLRRCLQLTMRLPVDKVKLAKKLEQIIKVYFSANAEQEAQVHQLIEAFMNHLEHSKVAMDQLLNAVFFILGAAVTQDPVQLREELRDALWKPLANTEAYD